MRILLVLALSVGVAACANQRAHETAAAPAPVELYVYAHSEITLEKGSRAWNELSDEERAAHDEEGGIFEDVTDRLLLQPRGGDRLAFCVQNYGRFLHMCQFSGVAKRTADGSYVYRAIDTTYDDTPSECGVVIKRTADKITLDELRETADPATHHNCHMYCGFHGILDEQAYALANRHEGAAEISAAQDENGGCPLPE